MSNYTLGGKPINPVNGHVAIVEIKDPFIHDTGDGTMRIVKDKWLGLCIGRVVAVDSSLPLHVVEVGDVVEFPSGHRTAIINIDGGIEVMTVREALLSFGVRGIAEDATEACPQEESSVTPPKKSTLNAGISRTAKPVPEKLWRPGMPLVGQA